MEEKIQELLERKSELLEQIGLLEEEIELIDTEIEELTDGEFDQNEDYEESDYDDYD